MDRVCDSPGHYVGFNFCCDWSSRSIIGEIVMGRCLVIKRVEVCWSGIIDYESGDWDRCVRDFVDDEDECREFVLNEWGVIIFVHRHPVYRVEGKQAPRAEQKGYRSNPFEPAR